MIVAEAALNVACAGARPVAVVNCLNFGNPEHPEVMWQLSEAIDGMGDACRALGLPVIGGNVSLYNESRGRDIDPTPVVGVLGVIERLERTPPGVGLVEGAAVVLLGGRGDVALGGSRWAPPSRRQRAAACPASTSRPTAVCSRWCSGSSSKGVVVGIHDVSDGGLGVALAEMARASGVGWRVDGIADATALVSEEPSRVIACVEPGALEAVRGEATRTGVPFSELGAAGGDRMVVAGLVDLLVPPRGD